MTKPRQITKGNYYHIYSIGVNKCDIFKDFSDYLLFQRMIKDFNTKEKVNLSKKPSARSDRAEKLVDVFCYTLMPNHFHFILKELVGGGVSLFLKKILGSYSVRFNNKYKRTGALFGSRFKDKLIESDQYFEHLAGYIWNNPIKLINPKYKSVDLFYGKIKLSENEKRFTKNYPHKKFPKNYFGPIHKQISKTKFKGFDF